MPGVTRPRSTSVENGTRGASRAVTNEASAGSGIGSIAAMRCMCGRGIFGLALDADETAAQAVGDGAGRAGAAERVEHQVVGPRRREDDARQQRLGLLRRMQLLAVAAFESFLAGAQRKEPIGAHLDVVVTRFQRLVIERIIALCGVARRPDQGLVRIGETAAAKIRHRIRFAPDDIVQDPEVEILKHRADAENVVVGTDDPKRRARLHQAASGNEPGAGEIVICGETREFVPVVVDCVDAGIVGTFEIALELQIVRRIGEY